ncbi:MAG: OB-fold domain-containing protein, partial [Patescibacteria group bacterium]
MITRITGTIVERGPELVVLEAGGIGYALRVPATLAVGLRDGEVVTLHTHFHVREDAQELYGFSD